MEEEVRAKNSTDKSVPTIFNLNQENNLSKGIVGMNLFVPKIAQTSLCLQYLS